MLIDLNFLKDNPSINWDSKREDSDNHTISFNINDNDLEAQLIIPITPLFKPYIRVNRYLALNLPHIGSSGNLCLQEIPKDLTLEEQIDHLLNSFFHDYILKIQANNFDDEFHKEAKNYWDVSVLLSQERIKRYVPRVICLNKFSENDPVFKEYYSNFITEKNIICASSTETDYSSRVMRLLSDKSPIQRIKTLEIRLNNSYIPSQFPRDKEELFNILSPFSPTDLINNYLQKRDKPSLIILRSDNCDYAYLIDFTIRDKSYYAHNKQIPLIPLYCDKADIEWIYGRYQKPDIHEKQNKKILFFGAGILGSQVLPLLIREGIGNITLVDYDEFDTPNLSRHTLGFDSLYKRKVFELEESLKKLPSCKIRGIATSAELWLNSNKLDDFDLILDLTGSGDVRRHINYHRQEASTPLITGWMEPYVCAGHAVVFGPNNYWTKNLWEDVQAFDSWPDAHLTNEPGCASRFQSYSGIEANKVISLIAEKTIYALENDITQTDVYSFIQNENYCRKQEHKGSRREWAKIDNKYESLIIKRDF